nr:hypothetical protein [Cupriavidus pauculus]
MNVDLKAITDFDVLKAIQTIVIFGTCVDMDRLTFDDKAPGLRVDPLHGALDIVSVCKCHGTCQEARHKERSVDTHFPNTVLHLESPKKSAACAAPSPLILGRLPLKVGALIWQVMRPMFLLEWIGSRQKRQESTITTNQNESYNDYARSRTAADPKRSRRITPAGC